MPNKRNLEQPKKIFFDDKLHIIWKDDSHYIYDFWDLRTSCPCANCLNQSIGEKLLKDEDVDKGVKPKVSEYMGNYAIRIDWDDNHNGGIYTYQKLRNEFPHQSQSTN